jgi:Holliday junction resolvasome RuvABC ATP-dependent DNA helicase subunit
LELDLSRKKLTMRAKESKLEDQIDFIVVARQFQPYQLIFIDEVHTNRRTGERKYGRA